MRNKKKDQEIDKDYNGSNSSNNIMTLQHNESEK